MINLVGPKGTTSLSVDGTDYAVVDGKVAVKPEHVADLKDFGFTVAPESVDDPNFEPSEDVDTMSRNELFAFLKASGVAVALPVTNDALRAMANDVGKPAKVVDTAKQKAIDDATAAAASAQADLDTAQKAFDTAVDADKDKAQAVLDAAKAAKTKADEALAAAQA